MKQTTNNAVTDFCVYITYISPDLEKKFGSETKTACFEVDAKDKEEALEIAKKEGQALSWNCGYSIYETEVCL